ncbi:hypothetical protein [Streptomyces sp.]|uniref:hypothetical protein n=1 Tax=Streptomyces sp. TaxID=1931 RepID=UPI002810A312|nr:hypothetical protein [Streptomyces sp.]
MIRELEHQAEDEQRRRETARRERSWTVTASRAAEGHPVLHRGNRGLARHGYGDLLDAYGVRAAVEEYPDLEMCEVCRPVTALAPTNHPPAPGRTRSNSPDLGRPRPRCTPGRRRWPRVRSTTMCGEAGPALVICCSDPLTVRARALA